MQKLAQMTPSEAIGRLISEGTLSGDDLAEFCKVKPKAVQSWIAGEYKPTGIANLAIHMVLRRLGIRYNGSLKCDHVTLEAGELLVLGLTHEEEMQREVGINATNNLLATLVGRRGHSRKRHKLLVDFVEKRREPLQSAIQHHPLLKPNKEKNVPGQEESKGEVSLPGVENGQKERTIMTFCHALAIIQPVAEDLASNKFSREERYKLRDLLKRKFGVDIFIFSDLINQLLSEKARDNIQQETQH